MVLLFYLQLPYPLFSGKQFQLIENSLDSEREKLKSVLYSGPYNELDICFNKIKSYIDSIIDVLRGMSNE